MVELESRRGAGIGSLERNSKASGLYRAYGAILDYSRDREQERRQERRIRRRRRVGPWYDRLGLPRHLSALPASSGVSGGKVRAGASRESWMRLGGPGLSPGQTLSSGRRTSGKGWRRKMNGRQLPPPLGSAQCSHNSRLSQPVFS
jgi:hypothetical protein